VRALANNIWVFDGDTVPFFTLPFTTRMTVVRLANNSLWIHSPIALSDEVAEQVDALGEVKYLIAPNHLHHLFIESWQLRYPSAKSYGTDEVIKKRSDLVFDGSLNVSCDMPWQSEIRQELFTGSSLMQECVFFHCPSRILIVTDLIENFSAQHFNFWQRSLARAAGIIAPNGKTPIDWRLSFTPSKGIARRHFDTIRAWQPEQIVMAHGEIIETEAVAFLERSFRWLKR
jgi:hypothetical protein